MQTFRAYLNGPTGTIIWAAWIEAADLATAQAQAARLSPEGKATVELWTPAARLPISADEFEAV
jgi:hypothetical protein